MVKCLVFFGSWELFEMQYRAPGSLRLAKQTKSLVKKTEVGLDDKCQMSLDYHQTAQYHYELVKEIKSLCERGLLIIGIANSAYNRGMVAWDKSNASDDAYDWASEAIKQ
jgi:4,5-DOPA dioxygenase extradiol